MKKNSPILVIILFFLVILLVGCKPNTPQTEGPTLTELKQTLTLEQTVNISDDFMLPKYVGSPNDLGEYNHSITWSSSNISVITIEGLNDQGTHYLAKVNPQETVVDLILTAQISLNNSTQSTTKTFNVSVAIRSNITSTYNAKKASDATSLTIRGVISYVNEKGFFVEDSVGVMYVYLGKTHTYQKGYQVEVTGTKATYNFSQNTMPQITNSPAPTITLGSYLANGYTKNPTTITYQELKDIPATDVSFFGKLVTISGIIESSSDYNTPYIIKEFGSNNYLGINIYTIASAKTELANHLGDYVTLSLITYDYYLPTVGDQYWRFLYQENSLELAQVPSLSDSEKIAQTKQSLINEFEGKKINASISLPQTNLYGVSISWVSDNVAISNTGIYTAPSDSDVVVHLTATITAGALSDTLVITMTAKKALSPSSLHVIINEVYGGGGNSGATYTHDFIELYNPTDEDIDLSGWSIQYASKAGDFNTKFTLSGIIKAKSYYLIQCGKGAGGTMSLPSPDASFDIAMAKDSFKVALADNDVKVTSPSDSNVVDFVGIGEANSYEGSGTGPKLDNPFSASRTNFIDTNDNASDFTKTNPTPQNSTSN